MTSSPSRPRTAQPPVVVGTRGSALSQIQTQEVVSFLQQHFGGRSFNVQVVRTRGDREQEAPLASLGLGVFTQELERVLLAGEVDLAVHSMKDLVTDLLPGLTIGAVPPRKDPRDALVSRSGHTLAKLPPGARVGTSSPRRAALVKSLRPDVEVVPIRGNVETRLGKVLQDQFDAAVLAVAGLARLGLADEIVEYFDPATFVPAVGQGALAVEVREGDEEIAALVRALDHRPSQVAVTAERAFLRALGGGCRVPIAAYGQVEQDALTLTGLIIAEDGGKTFQSQVTASVGEPEEAGRRLAQDLLDQGAGELLVEEGSE